MNQDQINVILSAHLKWLRVEIGGVRANLSGANLSGANLSSANLSSANLSGANLSSANLSSANLSSANLSSADLRGANLSGANLRGANLRSADLRGANLSGANLRGANLRGADLSSANLSSANLRGANLGGADLSGADLNSETIMPAASVLPEEGEFIAYKKVRNGIVLTLLVPEYAARLTGYGERKSRVSHAIPIRAQRDGNPVADTVFYSLHDSGFKYQLGIVAEVKDFCTDLRRVCAAGIHCYITKKEAEKHQ